MSRKVQPKMTPTTASCSTLPTCSLRSAVPTCSGRYVVATLVCRLFGRAVSCDAGPPDQEKHSSSSRPDGCLS